MAMMRGRVNSLAAAAGLKSPAAPERGFWPKQLDYPARAPAAFVLFLGYVLFFYLQGSYRIEFLGSIRFELITGSILVIVSFMSIAGPRARTKPRARSPVTGWAIGMIAIAGIMTALSHAPAISWDVFVDRVVKMAMMALFISSLVTTPTRLRWYLGAYLASFLKMAQEGVLGLFTGGLVWENQGTPRLHGSTPNYTHPNSFAGTQLITLPFIRYLVPLATNKWVRRLLIAQGVGAFVVVVTTGSRTGYVGLAVWLFFLWLQSQSRFKAFAFAIIAALAILPFIPEGYTNRFETIFTQKDAEGASIDMRKEILRDAAGVLGDHPLGVGVGAFSLVRQETFNRTQATHNLYLEVACDMGLQGLIVFTGFVMAMLLSARSMSMQADAQLARLPAAPAGPAWTAGHLQQLSAHRADLQLIRATALSVMSMLVIRLGLGLFGHDFYEVYWWFAAGLLIALHNMLGIATQRTDFFANIATPPDTVPAAASLGSTPAELST